MDDLITSRQLRGILGSCSEMHIWRLGNDPAYRNLRFPRAIKINRRNYYRLSEVRAWINVQAAREPKAA